MPSVEVIEHARRANNVPTDWLYEWCANECGELVFYPSGAATEAAARGIPLVIVCSMKCARERRPKL